MLLDVRKELLFRGKLWAQKKGIAPFFLRLVLHFVAFFWGMVSWIRNWGYDHRIFSVGKVDAFVVSIGNLVAGGTGKTPFTLLLAKKLLERGCRVGIISRGYGSSFGRAKRSVRITEEHWSAAGDEPCLLHKHLQNRAEVIVGDHRLSSAMMAVERGCRTLLLDDGMQARSFHRNLEITLLNARDLFGQGAFLPLGLLRERPEGLQRSDYIVLTHVKSLEHYREAKKRVELFAQKPMIAAAHALSSIKNLQGEEVAVKEGACALFCGIANPHLFCELVEKSGCSIVHSLFLPDHGFLSHEELLSFANMAKEKGASYILCTEKDGIKLDAETRFPLPVYYAELQLQFIDGKEIFEQMVEQIILSCR